MKMQPKTKTKRLENQRKPVTSTSTPPKIQTQNQSHPFFPFGSEVEVTSDEEGFRGAWYSATVLESPYSSSSFSLSSEQEPQLGKIFVEYKNLLSDENGSALLKEFVDVQFVRPKSPVDANDKVSFEVNDVVDAFYQDGWWCGVVTHVSSKSKYSVFFNNPPDEIEFDSSDLRIHKNWVDGKWVLPEKQRMRDLNFIPGTAVEVSIDPDNSCDVWFPASFIKQVANNSFLVEYQSSKEAGLQKVAVDSLHIRPSPPSSSNKAFNLLEKVDAFYESRWLSGVVTKILADGRYIVYFKRTKKEKELSHADLRLHMEWNNGKWIYSTQDTSMTPNSEKPSNLVNGGNKKIRGPTEFSDAVKNYISLDSISTINCKSGHKELQTPGSEKANYSSATPSNKRAKHTSANGDTSLSRSSRRLNEEPSSDVPLSNETCKSKPKQMEGSSHGTSVNLHSPRPGHAVLSKSKQGEDISLPSEPSEIKEDTEKHHASRKRGRPPKIRTLLSGDAVGEFVVQTPISSDENYGPIVIGLTHNGKMIDSHGHSSSPRLKLEHKKAVENVEKLAEDHESVVSNGSEQQKEGEVTNLKRKRGRPPKVLFRLGSPKPKETEIAEEEKKDDACNAKDDACNAKDDASYGKDDDERPSPSNEVENPFAVVEPSGTSNSDHTDFRIKRMMRINDQMKRLSELRKLSMRSTSKRQVRKQKKVPTGSVMLDLNEPVKPVILKKGKKQKSTKQVEPQTEDDVDNSRIRAIEVFSNGVSRDVDRVVAGTPSNASDDDRPLSAWFEGPHSLPTADSRIPPGETTGQLDENGEREETQTAPIGHLIEKEQEKREYSSVVNGSQVQDKNVPGIPDEMPIQSQSAAIVPLEERDLPFVKNSLIWELIENMEVLKRIPQKPHFHPLYNCKEECREGLAIGSMVTFTSLVERISKARFDDPKSLLDGYLEALVDLEELGFNVAPVREQLNTMISLKLKFEQGQNTSKEIESQIMERNLEKSTINEELSEVDKKIAELMEKRVLVLSKKERKEAEITLLQTSIDAIKGTLENAEQEFEKVTTSLW